jgi:hypothetical protein
MNILVDTNSVLDVLLERSPWEIDSSQVWAACEAQRCKGFLFACAVHNGLDAIVTRNPLDFAGAPLPVLTPAQLLARIP